MVFTNGKLLWQGFFNTFYRLNCLSITRPQKNLKIIKRHYFSQNRCIGLLKRAGKTRFDLGVPLKLPGTELAVFCVCIHQKRIFLVNTNTDCGFYGLTCAISNSILCFNLSPTTRCPSSCILCRWTFGRPATNFSTDEKRIISSCTP